MDPEASLENTQRSINRCDSAAAFETLIAYYQWRLRGGFQPLNGDQRAEQLSAALADLL